MKWMRVIARPYNIEELTPEEIAQLEESHPGLSLDLGGDQQYTVTNDQGESIGKLTKRVGEDGQVFYDVRPAVKGEKGLRSQTVADAVDHLISVGPASAEKAKPKRAPKPKEPVQEAPAPQPPEETGYVGFSDEELRSLRMSHPSVSVSTTFYGAGGDTNSIYYNKELIGYINKIVEEDGSTRFVVLAPSGGELAEVESARDGVILLVDDQVQHGPGWGMQIAPGAPSGALPFDWIPDKGMPTVQDDPDDDWEQGYMDAPKFVERSRIMSAIRRIRRVVAVINP